MCLCILYITANLTEVFCFVCLSANAVSSRDGLDTETGTESLLSHRRERERERARRRARETERKYYQWGADASSIMQLSCHLELITFHCLSVNSTLSYPAHSLNWSEHWAGSWYCTASGHHMLNCSWVTTRYTHCARGSTKQYTVCVFSQSFFLEFSVLLNKCLSWICCVSFTVRGAFSTL